MGRWGDFYCSVIARASGVGVRASGKKGIESTVSGIKNVLA
jgi:hypothetical protein